MKIKITMRHCYSPVLLENFKNSRHHSKIWRKCLFTCYKWKGKMVHRFCSIIWLYIEISKGNFTLPKSALSPSKPSSVPREISLLPGKGARDWGKHPRSPNVLLTFRALSKGYFLSCFTENWKKKTRVQRPGAPSPKGTFLLPTASSVLWGSDTTNEWGLFSRKERLFEFESNIPSLSVHFPKSWFPHVTQNSEGSDILRHQREQEIMG